MKNKTLLIYRILTGLFSILILLGVRMYFFQHEIAEGLFTALDFPAYLIYPMGVAKLLGLIAIWFINNKKLKEWAYAGFVFNLLLATSAHLNAGDGEFMGSVVVLLLVVGSYFYYRKLDRASELV